MVLASGGERGCNNLSSTAGLSGMIFAETGVGDVVDRVLAGRLLTRDENFASVTVPIVIIALYRYRHPD